MHCTVFSTSCGGKTGDEMRSSLNPGHGRSQEGFVPAAAAGCWGGRIPLPSLTGFPSRGSWESAESGPEPPQDVFPDPTA